MLGLGFSLASKGFGYVVLVYGIPQVTTSSQARVELDTDFDPITSLRFNKVVSLGLN